MGATRQWALRVNGRYASMDATRQWTLSHVLDKFALQAQAMAPVFVVRFVGDEKEWC